MERLLSDLRLAARSLWRQPGYLAVALIAMALGTGVNSAIFSVVKTVLLRPLPFERPDRLLSLHDVKLDRPDSLENPSPGNYLDWRKETDHFSGMAIWYPSRGTVRGGGGEPEAIQTLKVTPSFFDVLGMPALLGRTFREGEIVGAAYNVAEMDQGGDRVLVLSAGFWRRRFGSDPGVIGKTLSLDGFDWRIAAVMPDELSVLAADAAVFVPWDVPASYARFPAGPPRDFRFVRVVARLKDGVTREAADSRLRALVATLAARYPKENAGWSVRSRPLEETIVGATRRPLLVLFGATAFVLFIACVNVASLQLARASARAHETSVRVALGASRLQLLRHFLAEALLVSIPGAALGLLLAWGGLRLLLTLQPWELPRGSEIGIDAGVLLFSLSIAVVAALGSALAPALRHDTTPLAHELKGGSRNASPGEQRQRLRRTLVVLQVAASLVLLTGAGLFTRSFARASAVRPGFEARNLLVVRISLDKGTYRTGRQTIAFYEALLARLGELPGVVSTGAVTALPMSKVGVDFARPYWKAGDADPGGAAARADIRMATPGYVSTMGIPIVRGRAFTPADRAGAPPVVLVNETLARRVWPGEDPVGRSLVIDYQKGAYPYEVVGLVGDTRFGGLKSTPRPEIFIPHAQNPYLDLNLVLRTTTPPASLAAGVRRIVKAIDPGQPIHSVAVMEELVGASVAPDRFLMLLMSILAAVALTLAATGLYGILAYAIGRRRPELGLRVALGASDHDIVRLVAVESLRPTLAGAALGLLGALGLGRLVASLLFEVSPFDPWTFFAVTALLLAAVLAATVSPARRALRSDPAETLRTS